MESQKNQFKVSLTGEMEIRAVSHPMSVPYLTERLPVRGAGCESLARGDGLGAGARLLISSRSIHYYEPQCPLS